MRIITTVMLLAVVLAGATARGQAPEPPQAPATISVDEITTGMRGYGYTSVKGVRPERFEVEVLGVIRKIAPGRDAVIVRTSGLSLEYSGIFGGMSGSPVYIDGRLAGAVSFGWGFPKDPIGGFTPIAEMEEGAARRALEEPLAAATPRLDLSYLLDPQANPLGQIRPVAEVRVAGTAPEMPVTISVSALSSVAREVAEAAFPPSRFTLVEGAVGAAPADADAAPPLEPGSNLFVALVAGDMYFGAVGTVTDVRGREVYALGHPFLDLENVRVPMYSAGAVAVFPSTSRSFKIAYPIREIGAITRDFGTGVYGLVGDKPETFPVTVTLTRGGQSEKWSIASSVTGPSARNWWPWLSPTAQQPSARSRPIRRCRTVWTADTGTTAASR